MSTIPLPERPNVEQVKKRAKEIQRELGIPLHEAQLNLARAYGFASWPKLAKHIAVVTALTREPDTVAPLTDPADEFLRLACLTYGDDSPARRARASSLLTPELARRNIWIAAATASRQAVHEMLAADPTLASTEGGPFRWPPLMYLAYARFEQVPSWADTLGTAVHLLDAGADPNAGYLWHGFPSPFTVLTGVFGGGEQGPENQSPHPHSVALARLLLHNGADPNDSQTLYNRQFESGHEHLELLFAFGLGREAKGPWHERLPTALDAPTEMLRQQLRWAIHHNMVERVRLLAENGVDLVTPFDDERFQHAHGRTPAQFAVVCGHKRVVATLAEHGATADHVSLVDQFVGSILAGGGEAGVIRDTHPDVPRAAQQARPSLVVQAAATRRPNAVMGAVSNGFDVNALGRSDSPCEQPWQTALHTAVERNDFEMIELLITLGADPSIEDARFHATPKGWAEHFGNADLAALLT